MYIPQSYIVEVGYNQGGGDLVYSSDNQPYKGFYHKDKLNRFWTGKEHTNKSVLLINKVSPITLETITKNANGNSAYTNKLSDIYTSPFSILKAFLIKGDYIQPSNEDYERGFFTRYIVQLKLSHDPYIVEINEDTYKKLISSKSSLQYYITVSLLWKLTGPDNDVYDGNIRIESGIRDTNLRSLQEAKYIIPEISEFITDPFQFVNIENDGAEFFGEIE